jgi:alcohol dehydrogenase class IV
MLEGSLLARMASAKAGVTAVHAFAYPIGAEFHIPHGIANTLMLPPVMRFNLLGNLPEFAQIASAFCVCTEGLDELRAADTFLDAIERLAEGVMKVNRLLANNPRIVTLEDAKEIYKRAL